MYWPILQCMIIQRYFWCSSRLTISGLSSIFILVKCITMCLARGLTFQNVSMIWGLKTLILKTMCWVEWVYTGNTKIEALNLPPFEFLIILRNPLVKIRHWFIILKNSKLSWFWNSLCPIPPSTILYQRCTIFPPHFLSYESMIWTKTSP